MKTYTQYTLAAFLMLIVLMAACNTPSDKTKTADMPEAPMSSSTLAKRGEYLVGIMGCQNCHSPKRLGANGSEVIPELHLSGYPANRPVGKVAPEAVENGWTLFGADATSAVEPWGGSFSANITSDST